MKRFDKGYIYFGLFADFFRTIAIIFIFFGDFLVDEETQRSDIARVLPFLVATFVILYLCSIAYRIIYYKISGYELTEKEIKCNRGVFFRKRSVLDYTKIHAVNKRQNLFHKLFGIAILTVDSGSTNTSHQAEITIIENSGTVDLLLDELTALKENGAKSSTEEKEELLLSDKDTLYSFTSKRKMLYTLINIISTALFTAIFAVLTVVVLGICKLMLRLDVFGTWGNYFFFAFLIAVSAMLLFSVFVFIGCLLYSFIGYHDFKITKRGNEIRISFGLLERHTNTFSYDRIKAVKISQGLVQRMLGFAVIKLEVIGYTNNGEGDNNAELGVLVPFCKYSEVGEILSRILPDYVPEKKQTKAVSYFPFVSWFSLFLATVTGVVLLQTILPLLIFNVSPSVIATVSFGLVATAALVFIVKAISSVLAYQNNGIAIRDKKITACYGGFTKNITVFMKKNLIAAESATTPLRQKSGISTIVMHLKTNAMSNEIKVHMQTANLSQEIEQLLIL